MNSDRVFREDQFTPISTPSISVEIDRDVYTLAVEFSDSIGGLGSISKVLAHLLKGNPNPKGERNE